MRDARRTRSRPTLLVEPLDVRAVPATMLPVPGDLITNPPVPFPARFGLEGAFTRGFATLQSNNSLAFQRAPVVFPGINPRPGPAHLPLRINSETGAFTRRSLLLPNAFDPVRVSPRVLPQTTDPVRVSPRVLPQTTLSPVNLGPAHLPLRIDFASGAFTRGFGFGPRRF